MALELLTASSREMTPSQLNDVIQLCSQVFKCDYSYYMNLPLDRVHVLGYIDGLLVSHALWLDRRLRIGSGPWRIDITSSLTGEWRPFELWRYRQPRLPEEP